MTTLSTATRPPDTDDQWSLLAQADPTSAAELSPWRTDITAKGMARPADADSNVSRWVATHCTGTTGVVVMPGASPDLPSLYQHLPDGHRLLVLERNPARLAPHLADLPFGTGARSGRLVFAVGNNPTQITEKFLAMWRLQEVPAFNLYPVDTDPDSAALYHTALSEAIRDARLRIMNAGTLIQFGAMWQFNTLRNLPRLALQPGISTLTGAFTGRTAIIIGAGPSLNDALPYLKAAAPGAVTLAVATALRPLRQAGIRPDLVVSVDGHSKTASQYQAPCEDLFLACSTLIHPPAVGRFRGAFTGNISSNPIDTWLNSMLPPRGAIMSAGTVTLSAMDLAVQMGCNPIITVGFDLSFRDDGTTHARNTMYHNARVETNHSQIVWVPGNRQNQVPTSRQFSSYIALAARFVTQNPDVRLVNANNGGAQIAGMIPADLEDLPQLVGAPFDAFARITELHQAYRPPSVASILSTLRNQNESLSRLVSDARLAASLCNGLMRALQSLTPDPIAIEGLLNELEQADARMTSVGLSSELVEMSMWAATFALGIRSETTGMAPHTAGIAANKEWRRFYEQIAGAAMWTRDLLRTVVLDLEHISGQTSQPDIQTQQQGRLP